MNLVTRFCGVLLLFALLPAARGQLQPPTLRVSSVVITNIGPPAASEAFVRANIRVKAGDDYLPLAVDDDEQTLYATGLFYNIQVARDFKEGGVALTYIL